MSNKTIKIMIASPGDVSQERQAVRDVINNVNYWAVFANICFETIDWENNTYPINSTYPQNAINQQIGNSYDILIGIFWTKVGSPTPKYPSGTIEEIENALKKSTKKKNIDVMVYFKMDEAPHEMIDSCQIEKLNNYKNKLSEKGVYFWEFKGLSNYKNYLSQHLALLVQRKYWSKDKQSVKLINDFKNDPIKLATDNYNQALLYRKEVNEIILMLALYHQQEAEEINGENEKINSLLKLSSSHKAFNEIRKVFDKSTLRIIEQNKNLEKEISDFKYSFLKMFSSYSNAVLMNEELKKKTREQLLTSILSLVELITGYENIKSETEKSIKLHETELKDCRFPAYNRALRKYLRTKNIYRDMFIDSIYMIKELEKVTRKII